VLVLVHVAILAHVAHWQLTGTTWTPLEPSEAMRTLELGWVNAGFVLLVVALVATLVWGRFFCGWACHVVAYQDLCAAGLGRLGWRPRAVRSRLLAWVPVAAAFYMFAWPSLARVLRGDPAPELRAHFRTADFWDTFPGPWVAALTFLVDGALVVWLFGAKGFCTYGCPYGALFGAVDRFAPGRIRVTDACEGCGHCTARCTSNVRVHEEVARHGQVVDPGCMKCMDCVSVCPKNALYFGFSGSSERGSRKARSARAYDFTWPQELFLAAAFAGGFFVFRGLYARVPFLLALGLGAVTAAAAWVVASFARRGDVELQGRLLRAGGRVSRSGRVVLVGALAFTLLTVHSAAVHASGWFGERALLRADPEAGADELAESRRWLERSSAWGLFGNAVLEHQLGSIAHASGDVDAAREHLERSIELEPSRAAPRVLLGEILLAEGALEPAGHALEGAIDVARPEDPRERALALRARRKRADVAIRERDWELAERWLVELVEERPGDARSARDLARVRSLRSAR